MGFIYPVTRVRSRRGCPIINKFNSWWWRTEKEQELQYAAHLAQILTNRRHFQTTIRLAHFPACLPAWSWAGAGLSGLAGWAVKDRAPAFSDDPVNYSGWTFSYGVKKRFSEFRLSEEQGGTSIWIPLVIIIGYIVRDVDGILSAFRAYKGGDY